MGKMVQAQHICSIQQPCTPRCMVIFVSIHIGMRESTGRRRASLIFSYSVSPRGCEVHSMPPKMQVAVLRCWAWSNPDTWFWWEFEKLFTRCCGMMFWDWAIFCAARYGIKYKPEKEWGFWNPRQVSISTCCKSCLCQLMFWISRETWYVMSQSSVLARKLNDFSSPAFARDSKGHESKAVRQHQGQTTFTACDEQDSLYSHLLIHCVAGLTREPQGCSHWGFLCIKDLISIVTKQYYHCTGEREASHLVENTGTDRMGSKGNNICPHRRPGLW